MSHGYRRGGGRGRRGGGGGRQEEPKPTVDESSPLVQQFLGYQKLLDTRHDKHERLVKLSRDVTIESKRTIFLLQRISGEEEEKKIFPEAEKRLAEIQTVRWRPIAAELDGEDPYRFIRAYSPGLQEYIEALSFYHFLKHGALISPEAVSDTLIFPRLKQQDEKTDDMQSTEGATASEKELPPSITQTNSSRADKQTDQSEEELPPGITQTNSSRADKQMDQPEEELPPSITQTDFSRADKQTNQSEEELPPSITQTNSSRADKQTDQPEEELPPSITQTNFSRADKQTDQSEEELPPGITQTNSSRADKQMDQSEELFQAADQSEQSIESDQSELPIKLCDSEIDHSNLTVSESDKICVHIPPIEYVLGIADLTGEIMRMAIHSIGSGDLDKPFQLCNFLRTVYDAFITFGNVNRELSRKLYTLKQSLRKVEMACYTLKVRGSEIPKQMLADALKNLESGQLEYEEGDSPMD